MENKRIGAAQAKPDAVAVSKNPKSPTKSASEAGSGQKAGRARGAAIGGAVGHAIGVAKDVVLGAVSGGVAAGKSGANEASEHLFDTTTEHEYWRNEFKNRSYFRPDTPYEQFGPAYQYGWECCQNHSGKKFQDVEAQLRADWESHRGDSRLNWAEARMAVQDAWSRAEQKCSAGTGCS